ncbi:MAG TPA: hypothetical protein VF092_21445 [Longimicrobium sp.]
MYYDDSSRRLNLLSGLVFGTVLGAGLALLFLPDERLETGRRVVVRTARSLGRTAREGAGAARGRMDALRERLRDDGRGDDEPEPTRAWGRARALARRRFEL